MIKYSDLLNNHRFSMGAIQNFPIPGVGSLQGLPQNISKNKSSLPVKVILRCEELFKRLKKSFPITSKCLKNNFVPVGASMIVGLAASKLCRWPTLAILSVGTFLAAKAVNQKSPVQNKMDHLQTEEMEYHYDFPRSSHLYPKLIDMNPPAFLEKVSIDLTEVNAQSKDKSVRLTKGEANLSILLTIQNELLNESILDSGEVFSLDVWIREGLKAYERLRVTRNRKQKKKDEPGQFKYDSKDIQKMRILPELEIENRGRQTIQIEKSHEGKEIDWHEKHLQQLTEKLTKSKKPIGSILVPISGKRTDFIAIAVHRKEDQNTFFIFRLSNDKKEPSLAKLTSLTAAASHLRDICPYSSSNFFETDPEEKILNQYNNFIINKR